MDYELFAYAIVVALMAIYVYNNERRMGEMFCKLDQTAQLQQILHFFETKFAEIAEKTNTKLLEAENRHKLTTDQLQKNTDDITNLTQLQQQTLDSLDKKMADIGKKNEIKLQDTENRNNLTTSRLQKQLNEMTELAQLQQQTLDSLDKKMADIEKKNEMKLQDTENRNSLTISHLQKQLNDMKKLGPSIVTFLALLISPTYGSIAVQATVKFQKTIENIGSGYNTETGIFTAPTKGLYQFTASARQSHNGFLHLGLFRNNEQMSVSVAANSISLTIGATFTLQSGDRVCVKNVWDKPSGIVGVGQTYFSGSLVHKM
ncbi:uncharacterized protein LOC134702024 [Mytilus trossulus]|uniref:uncharacterized protein LOC134702024 n=1 Tax=Mytilus trossulus TaxID=6551 RepID=UPI003004396C